MVNHMILVTFLSDFIKEIPIEWQLFNLFDHKDKSNKLSSTGLTILRKDD